MRIAFLLGEFPSLTETFILNQITGLIARGHEVDIYARRPRTLRRVHSDVEKYNLLDRCIYYPDIPTDKLSRLIKALALTIANCHKDLTTLLKSLVVFRLRKDVSSLVMLYRVIPYLDKKPYDVIHCHFGSRGNLGVLLKDIGAIEGKIITTFHGNDISASVKRHGTDVYDYLFSKGDLFLPISERWKDKLIQIGCSEGRIIVHRMGIDTSKFTFSSRKVKNNGKVRLLTVGRLVEKKGVEYGVKAAARVLKKHPGIEYKIAGDGPLRSDIERLIEELGVAANVKLIGWKEQEEIIKLMQHAHIILAPSVTGEDGDQEGIPVVLMEALAQGLPVVSSHHSGIPELVQDGVSGFLVPERDVDALTEKLTYLIEHPDVWLDMGRAGHEYVQEHYDIDKLNDRLVEVYENLVVGKIP